MILKSVLLAFVGLSLFSCTVQKKTINVPSKELGTIELRFIPVVDGKPFFIDSVYTSPGGDLYKISNCKFFVSNIALSSALGKEEPGILEHKIPVLLIDFSKSNDTTKQGIPSVKQSIQVQTAAYTDVRFDIGLPRQLNHTDPTNAPPPLDLAQQDMYWEWNSGYIFLLVEGQLVNQKKEPFHFAIGGDNKIMPFAHGNLFNVVPLVQVKKGQTTTLNFTFDFNIFFKNGDGSNYPFDSEKNRIVHGGYFADILSTNAKHAIHFKSVEIK